MNWPRACRGTANFLEMVVGILGLVSLLEYMNTHPTADPSAAELLRRSALGEPAACRALMQRYFLLVYAAALRRCGNHAMAEDAAQLVFVDLLRRAKSLKADERLGGWLHQRAVRAAGDLMKSELRRKKREAEAASRMEPSRSSDEWAAWAPHIDCALQRLPAADRDAILLRCMEGRDFAEVGAALGISDDAAQKRVSRALEKVRGFLPGRGSVPAVAVIIGGLAADRAGAAALTSVCKRVCTAAVNSAAVTAPAVPWLLHLKAGLAGAAVVAAVFAWPLAAALKARSAGPSAPLSNNTAQQAAEPSGMKALRFSALPKLEDGLSVEEIVCQIGLLAGLPRTDAIRERFDMLARQLAGARAGAALRLMRGSFSADLMALVDQRHWRRSLLYRWNGAERVAALDHAWEIVKSTESEETRKAMWDYATDAGREPEAGENHAAALKWWAGATLDMARLPPERRVANNWKDLLGFELAVTFSKTNDPASDELALRLENEHRLPVVSPSADYTVDIGRLIHLAELAPRLESPAARAALLGQVAERLGQVDFSSARAWIEAIPHAGQRMLLARRAAFPPHLTRAGDSRPQPQDRYKSRADWLLGLAGESQRPAMIRDLAAGWLEIDPEWCCSWLQSKLPTHEWLNWLEGRISSDAASVAAHGKVFDSAEVTALLIRQRRATNASSAEAFFTKLKEENRMWIHVDKLNALLKP